VRKLPILTFILLVSLSSVAQNDGSLQGRLDEYLLANKQKNFEKLMEFIYPELFQIVPKEQMIQVFESVFDNPQMTISMDSLSVCGISKGFNYKVAEYRKVDYYIGMSFRFKDTAFVKDENKIAMIKEQVKTQMGAEHVKYIPEENRMTIDAKKIMFAIKDNAQSQWMFLGYEPKQVELMKKLIPSEVLTNFKL
jgi:hypothetical protein